MVVRKMARENGQTMAEYAVVLAVITAAVVASFAGLAGAIEKALQRTLEIVSGIA